MAARARAKDELAPVTKVTRYGRVREVPDRVTRFCANAHAGSAITHSPSALMLPGGWEDRRGSSPPVVKWQQDRRSHHKLCARR